MKNNRVKACELDGCAGLAGWLQGDNKDGCRDEEELRKLCGKKKN